MEIHNSIENILSLVTKLNKKLKILTSEKDFQNGKWWKTFGTITNLTLQIKAYVMMKNSSVWKQIILAKRFWNLENI